MKKVIGLFSIVCMASFGLSASPTDSQSSIISIDEKSEIIMPFCDAGWGAVDGYYDGGGNDGFVAAQIFELACG